MRYKLYFRLENEKLPIQYRECILSFFKLCLTEYDQACYERLYSKKDNRMKPFTFAAFFHKPKFMEDKILLENREFELNISIQDVALAIILYNAFNHQRNKKFSLSQNSMTLENISMLPEKEIKEEKIRIKFLSPLIVRDRNQETKKDYYYSSSHANFKEMLKINIREELKIIGLPIELIETFQIEPIEPKKTVVKFYEKQIEGSLGIYEIEGNVELLKFLYQAGMGSKRSSGFGMFTII